MGVRGGRRLGGWRGPITSRAGPGSSSDRNGWPKVKAGWSRFSRWSSWRMSSFRRRAAASTLRRSAVRGGSGITGGGGGPGGCTGASGPAAGLARAPLPAVAGSLEGSVAAAAPPAWGSAGEASAWGPLAAAPPPELHQLFESGKASGWRAAARARARV